MVAWTDAAGKYNPEAPFDGNEDNFYVDDNLGDETPSHFVADKTSVLSECGLLMAVADGMGGMNAGEIASQIAHDTVADYFKPGRITPQLAASHESRARYMENVIREADKRIKKAAHEDRSRKGMGSTLIMAWLAGSELTVTWIGDSRAYRFNPATGIEPLSKDHSYVQELVDKGILTYEETFEHPQGNIITRSLGDDSKKAQPESRLFQVHNGDIILLCSDGLSGVLRDRAVCDENGNVCPGENMEDIISGHSVSLSECRKALWEAAERAGWYDNVTAILCEIRNGATDCMPESHNSEEEVKEAVEESRHSLHKTFDGLVIRIPRKRIIPVLIIPLILLLSGGGLYFFRQSQSRKQSIAVRTGGTDTVRNNSQKLPEERPRDSTVIKAPEPVKQSTGRKEILSGKRPEKNSTENKQKKKTGKNGPVTPPAGKKAEKKVSLEELTKVSGRNKKGKDTQTRSRRPAELTPVKRK